MINYIGGFLPDNKRIKNETAKTIKNIRKSIFAMPALSAAKPEKPKKAAIRAKTKKIKLQSSNI